MTKLIPPTPMIEQYLEERRNYRVAMITREPYSTDQLDEMQLNMTADQNKVYGTMSNKEFKCKS